MRALPGDRGDEREPGAVHRLDIQHDVRELARTLGYRDGPEASALERFEADRRRHLVAVRGLHEKLFYRPLLEAFGAVPAGLDPEGASERLAALGFANPDRAMASLRALTGIVSQDTVLLNDTVHANIAYGTPAATREQVEAAARAANGAAAIPATISGATTGGALSGPVNLLNRRMKRGFVAGRENWSQ